MAWLTGWTYRKELTVQATNVDALLSDFPCLVKVSNDADLAAALATGYDVRFTQSDGETLLKYERESWTGGGGSNATAQFWVKVPSISATTGATFYIYYGKAGAADGEDATNVWDSDFTAVFHLSDATTSTVADSTINGYTGTKTAANEPNEITGKINDAQNFDGSNDKIDTNETVGTLLSASTGVVSCWVKCEGSAPSTSTAYQCDNVWGNPVASRWLGLSRGIVSGSDRLWAWNWDGSEDRVGITYTANTWHHVAWRHVGGTLYAYKDGALVSSTASGNTSDTSNDIFIGSADSAQYFEGEVDEIRFSDADRSADWTKFEHANAAEADNELTWGSEETQSADGNPWYYDYQQRVAA